MTRASLRPRVRSAVTALVALLVGLAAIAQSTDDAAPALHAPTPAGFAVVEVVLDTGATPLAAWQIELTTSARLVGIEGGDHPAYAKPAFYDPAALSDAGGGRIILAAFNTAAPADLPTGPTLIARFHVAVDGGDAAPTIRTTRLIVAADAAGDPIPGTSASVRFADDTRPGGTR